MLAHQLLKDIVAREKSESLAEPRAAAEAGELTLVGKTARLQLMHAEKMSELGVLAIENRARLPDAVLPSGKSVDVHRMVVPRNRLRVVADLQSARFEAVGKLDILPRRGRKRRIKWIGDEQLPVDRDVRGIEKIKRNRP